MQIREKIAELALEYVAEKVPYQHRGISREGCDCTGLLVAILKEMGYLQNFELRPYKKDWNLHAGAGNQIIEELEKVGNRIENRLAGVGDVAVMLIGKFAGHCGIIARPGPIMVHSLNTEKFVKKSILRNSKWASRWLATYRIDVKKLTNNYKCLN